MSPLSLIPGVPQAKLILAAVSAAVLIALVLTGLHWRSQRDHARDQLALCNAKQQVNLASIGTLSVKLREQIASIDALAATGAAAKAASERKASDALIAARERDKPLAAASAALKVNAGRGVDPAMPCVVSPAVMAAAGRL